ncbi:hypothetical protein D3C75_432450 [compost metagenome]
MTPFTLPIPEKGRWKKTTLFPRTDVVLGFLLVLIPALLSERVKLPLLIYVELRTIVLRESTNAH